MAPVKLATVLAVFMLCLLFCQWVNRDTQALKFARAEMWNGLVLGGAILGTAALLLAPWRGGLFAVGVLFFFLLAGGAGVVYVVYRNSEVVASAKVFTPAHLKRVLASLGKPKDQQLKAVEKVKLKGADGKKVPVPTAAEMEEVEAYTIAQDFLFDALWRRAAEINLVIQGDRVRLAYRIDGAVVERDPLEYEQAERLLGFMRRIAGQDADEHRRPQFGKVQAMIPGAGSSGKMEISIRTEGSTAGERLYLRVTSDESKLRLPDLGLTESQLTKVEAMLAEPKGLILMSAPRRNGLTTTMYAVLRHHDAFIQHLHTLEKAPLMDLENVTQNIFRTDGAGKSFGRQLATILRREPDVVMVEACEDEETATLLAKASQDRKLYAGVVADDSFSALQSFLNLCENRMTAGETLLAVTCQRLVRKLCPSCKQPYKPDPNVLRKANMPVTKDQVFYQPPPEPEVDKKGNPIICGACQGSGYYGRIGVVELLVLDDVIREMIKGNASIKDIRDQARKNQMRYVWEEGLVKVNEGITGMNEILRVLQPGAKKKK